MCITKFEIELSRDMIYILTMLYNYCLLLVPKYPSSPQSRSYSTPVALPYVRKGHLARVFSLASQWSEAGWNAGASSVTLSWAGSTDLAAANVPDPAFR